METLFGNPLSSERVFLVTPRNLGTLTAGYSNLKATTRSTTKSRRLFIRTSATIGAALLSYAVCYFFRLRYTPTFFITLGAALVALLIARGNTPSVFYHAFIGTRGMAEYGVLIDSMEPSLRKELLFEKAAFLLRSVTNNYRNGAYQDSDYSYSWYNAEGEEIFSGSGTYNNRTSVRVIENVSSYTGGPHYYFLLKGELAWTQYLVETSLERMKRSNMEVEFQVMNASLTKQEGSLILSPRKLAVDLDSISITFSDDELKSITFKDGHLLITDTEYKWKLFGRQGNKISIPVSRIANTLYFIQMAKTLLNISE